jgi:hypothetical protein
VGGGLHHNYVPAAPSCSVVLLGYISDFSGSVPVLIYKICHQINFYSFIYTVFDKDAERQQICLKRLQINVL